MTGTLKIKNKKNVMTSCTSPRSFANEISGSRKSYNTLFDVIFHALSNETHPSSIRVREYLQKNKNRRSEENSSMGCGPRDSQLKISIRLLCIFFTYVLSLGGIL